MTYHSQLNLIMLVTVIGLAFFLYLKPQFQSETDGAIQISIRQPETVQSIRIIRQGQETALERNERGWHLISPFYARADEAVVGKVLNVLSAHSRQRFPLRDTESFNLDFPSIELYIDDDYFAFGGMAPITNEQYLAINDHVYLVSPRYAVWMPVSSFDLVSPSLLAKDELPVKFELGDLTIKKQNGVWLVDSGGRSSQDSIVLERWVEKWRDMPATELLINMQDYSDDQSTVTISLMDGREIDLKVIENESGIMFYRQGEQVGYLFPEQEGHHLLNPFFVMQE